MLLELRALLALTLHLMAPLKLEQLQDLQAAATALANAELEGVLLRLSQLVSMLPLTGGGSGDSAGWASVAQAASEARLQLGHCVQACHGSLVAGAQPAEQVLRYRNWS